MMMMMMMMMMMLRNKNNKIFGKNPINKQWHSSRSLRAVSYPRLSNLLLIQEMCYDLHKSLGTSLFWYMFLVFVFFLVFGFWFCGLHHWDQDINKMYGSVVITAVKSDNFLEQSNDYGCTIIISVKSHILFDTTN